MNRWIDVIHVQLSRSTLRRSTIREFGRLRAHRGRVTESAVPIAQPITRNPNRTQGSLPMKRRLCSHQRIKLPHKIHQSLSLRFHLTLMLNGPFGLGDLSFQNKMHSCSVLLFCSCRFLNSLLSLRHERSNQIRHFHLILLYYSVL